MPASLAAEAFVNELDGLGQFDKEILVLNVINVDEEVLEGLAILGEGLILEVFEVAGVEGDEGEDVCDFAVQEGLGAAEGP